MTRKVTLLVPLLIGLVVVAAVVIAVTRTNGAESTRVDAAVAALRAGPGGHLELAGGTLVHEGGSVDVGGVGAATSQTWITDLDDEAIVAAIGSQLVGAGFVASPIGRPPLGTEHQRQLGWWRRADLLYRLSAQPLPARIGARQYSGVRTAAAGLLTKEPVTP